MPETFVSPPRVAISTSFVSAYVVPTATIGLCFAHTITNTHASEDLEPYARWLDASDSNTARPLTNGGEAIPPGKSAQIFAPQTLAAGDALQFKRGSTGTMEVSLSILEQT
ncbi:hypothetical protein [Azospirillum sp. ST 5-10]|uniref:hypothetical protein n=1 Tax=unclassified Azospirillum TaxID=2630922 RepID=UPI003F4A7BF0